ncbi:MAG: LysR family transcriptional regulator, partial [Alphaproteobacteria bacterium]|nr:LysR family transcriptional regulator [Alphaproteobacteria bacterium]
MSLDWNDLRYFLELGRNRRLVAAAKRLGVDHTTVGRRIAALEKSVGTRLVMADRSGYVLTEAGQRLFAHAEGIEGRLAAAVDEVGGRDLS